MIFPVIKKSDHDGILSRNKNPLVFLVCFLFLQKSVKTIFCECLKSC